MKASRIPEILDLAVAARKNNMQFNPLFKGGAGVGKSEVCQQWVRKEREADENFGFIDLRLAYYEAPDVIGFPTTDKDASGLLRTHHCLPDFWPTSGSGLILLEEINRATTGVTNTMMQLLTDRKVGPYYELPPGWIVAGCINPDDANYDVNAMDTALSDRFEIFDIDYDHMTFVDYIESKKWNECVLRYIKSGAWTYKSADSISKDGKYISPRTWSKLNAAEVSGAQANRQLHRTICQSILGKHVGNEYWKSCWDDAPVTAQDILRDRKAALKKLKTQSQPDTYQGDRIAVTVESIIQYYGGWFKGQKDDKNQELPENKELIDEPTMAEIASIIPSDQALVLVKGCGYAAYKGAITNFFRDFSARHPECVDVLRSNIRVNRIEKDKK